MQIVVAASASIALFAAPALAQCSDYVDAFGTVAGIGDGNSSNEVLAFARFDDGSGPAFFASGVFNTASGVSVDSLAKWNGSAWSSPFASGSPGFAPVSGGYLSVAALTTWNDGTGDALYVGGYFSAADGVQARSLARWNGASWSALGTGLTNGTQGPSVGAMLPWNDGSGDALYVGGRFTQAGGVAVNNVAKWSGSTWSALGGGVGNGTVNALAELDDGSGSALYVCGTFNTANGAAGLNIQRWNGAQWSALGPGLTGNGVNGMVAFDDGSGPALYAHGTFSNAGNVQLATIGRWKNGQWSQVGGNAWHTVYGLGVHDDGGGPALYAFARTATPPSTYALLKLAGASWVEVTRLSGFSRTLASIDLGTGAQLYAGGHFDRIGDALCARVARFDGQQWSGLGSGGGRNAVIETLASHDAGNGQELYMDSGSNSSSDMESIVRWTGSSWAPVGALSDGDVHALVRHDDGTGPKLYAGGDFYYFGWSFVSSVAVFDGSAWVDVGGTSSFAAGTTWTLASWPSANGPRLVAGGEFTGFAGIPANFIAVWDGTSWSALNGGMNNHVLSLGTFGQDLYAGGAFTLAGGVSASRIARWNGTQWSALGSGLNGVPWCMLEYDDGSGPALFVGGEFTQAGGAQAKHIAKWDGAQWSQVGAGVNASVSTLRVFDDGSGPRLYAGGPFTSSGTTSIAHLARWDGNAWTEVDATCNGSVQSLAVVDRANGTSSLFFGGAFGTAGGLTSQRVAELRRELPCAPVAYCTAKTNSQGCVPSIYSTGDASLSNSTLRVRAANVINNKNGVLFWGLAPTAAPFQGGLKCVQSPTVRTPSQSSGGNPPPDDCSGAFAYYFGASYMASFALVPGERIYCQYWSRDPLSPSTTNLTDGLSFLVAP